MNNSNTGRPQAFFLDRDGTLIEWVHYIDDPDKVVLIPGVAEALKRAKSAGCRLFMHTNQSGVGRGYCTMREVAAVNARMYELMEVDEAFFDEVCIATDSPDQAGEDSYRKPSPRFPLDTIRKYGLDYDQCWFIGDSECDVQTGLAAGIRTAKVGGKSFAAKSEQSFDSVVDFVDWVFPD